MVRQLIMDKKVKKRDFLESPLKAALPAQGGQPESSPRHHMSPSPFAIPSPGLSGGATSGNVVTTGGGNMMATPGGGDMMARLQQRQHMFSQFGELLCELQARDKGVEAWRTLAASELEAALARCREEAQARSRAEQLARQAAAEASARSEEALEAQRQALERCEETERARSEAKTQAEQVTRWKARLDAAEARFASGSAIDMIEKARLRRALEELNSALGACRGAAEAARADHERSMLTARREVEAQREAFGRELDVMRLSVEAAEADRDRALAEIQLTVEASKQAELALRDRERSRIDELAQWTREADIEREARTAANAATYAAVALKSRAEQNERSTRADAELRLGSARDATNEALRERDAVRTALSELEMRWRGYAKREEATLRKLDAAEAEASSCRAAFADARGDLALAAASTLVAHEERDAARDLVKQERAVRADSAAAADAVAQSLRFHHDRAAKQLADLNRAASERIGKEASARDALLAAFEAQSLLSQLSLLECERSTAERNDRLSRVSDALQTELDLRLRQLGETTKILEREREEAAVQRKRRLEEKKAFDEAASEREARQAAERRNIGAEVVRERARATELECEKRELASALDAAAAREALLGAQLADADRCARHESIRLEDARRAARDLMAECRTAKSRHAAAEGALVAQNSAANESLAEANRVIETLRNDVKRATRAGAERVAQFRKVAAEEADRFSAAEAAAQAAQATLDAANDRVMQSEDETAAAHELAIRADASARHAMEVARTTSMVDSMLVSVADAATACVAARANCDTAMLEMRCALASLDAEVVVEHARASASSARADAATAVAEARLDRETAADQAKRAREAHAAANEALRRASSALAREREYAHRLEKDGFDEVVEMRDELTALRKRVKTAEVDAEAARKEGTEARNRLHDAQQESSAAVNTLTARLRAAERLVDVERERSSTEEADLKSRAAQAERDAAGAIQAARDANAALRSELQQQRAAAYNARQQLADFERKLDETSLARDAALSQLDDLRAGVADANERARRATIAEDELRAKLDDFKQRARRKNRAKFDDPTDSLPLEGDFERMRRRWRSRAQAPAQSDPPLQSSEPHFENLTEAPHRTAKQQPSEDLIEAPHRTAKQQPSERQTNDESANKRENHVDDEIKRHLTLAAQARAGGLLPTPREDEEDDADTLLRRYESQGRAPTPHSSSREHIDEQDAERRMRTLEEGAFTDQAHSSKRDAGERPADGTTKAIAAAALYLERRRQRDAERQLAEAASDTASQVDPPMPLGNAATNFDLPTLSASMDHDTWAAAPATDLNGLEIVKGSRQQSTASRSSSRTSSSSQSSSRDGGPSPFSVAHATVNTISRQRKRLPKIAPRKRGIPSH